MGLFPRQYSMKDVKICSKCDDEGCLQGKRYSPTDPTLYTVWIEVCPYCMPTNKYGNLEEKLKLAAESDHIEQKLLPHNPDEPEEKL